MPVSVTTLTGGALLFSDWMNGPLFLSLLVGWIIMGHIGIMGATACDLASELVRKKKRRKTKKKKFQRKKKQTKKNKTKTTGKNLPGYCPHVHVPLVFSRPHLFITM